MNVDPNTLKEFVDALLGITGRQFSKELNSANVEYAFSGIVIDVDNDSKIATIDIGDSTIEDIPNRTGEALSLNDTVKVFSDRRNMVGAYVGVKLASYVKNVTE